MPVKKLKIFFGLLGLGLFILTASELGWKSIGAQLESLGWAIVVVTAMRTVSQIAFTIGLGLTLPESERRIRFFRLFCVRLAGEALNYLIPAGTVGGEPVKAKLLSSSIGLANAIAGVAVGKFSQIVAQLLVMVCGAFYAAFALNLPGDVKIAMFAALAVIAVGLAILYAGQRMGMFGWAGRLLARVPLGHRFIEGRFAQLAKLDAIILEIHGNPRGKFPISLVANMCGWLGGAVETYVVLWMLGTPRSLGTAFIIEALSLIISAALFIVPWQAGTQESGKALVFGLCGLSPAAGFAVGIVMRLRDLIWVGAGLIALALFREPEGPHAHGTAGEEPEFLKRVAPKTRKP